MPLNDTAQLINTSSFLAVIWWPAYRRLATAPASPDSVQAITATHGVLERALWLALGIEVGYFSQALIARAEIDPKGLVFDARSAAVRRGTPTLPTLALERLWQLENSGILRRGAAHRATVEINDNVQ